MNLKRALWTWTLSASFIFSSATVLAARRGAEFDRRGVHRSAGDLALIQAVEKRREVHFLEAAQMEVIQILPDDTDGRAHQKFMVRLSNGQKVMAVYNLDLCERVPVKIGDRVDLGGQFIWTNQGGLVHWLHHDPANRRPDGYVGLNGRLYCN